MTKKEIKDLHKQAMDLFKKAKYDDEIVLCKDGKETRNIYEASLVGEPDMKTPSQWVDAIVWHHEWQHETCKLSFILRKAHELPY